MTTDHVTVRRALLSVSDKTGLTDLVHALHGAFGVDLISTGGTARHLRDAGLPVADVGDVTGFPEMMAGRVKTLHPTIHGGLLGRPEDRGVMAEHGIRPIDLVVVNLYPFEQTVSKPGVTDAEAVENIDIGGPSMLRSAAKNHARVAVLCDPADYAPFLDGLRANNGATTPGLRRRLATKTFGRTADYDRAIHAYLTGGATR